MDKLNEQLLKAADEKESMMAQLRTEHSANSKLNRKLKEAEAKVAVLNKKLAVKQQELAAANKKV